MAHAYRDDFPLLKSQDVAYLDNAATAQRPQCVLDAEREFYTRHNANPLRGLYPLSIEATEALESARAAVMGELRRAFRPEFLNRLDEIIMFKPLTKENLSGIIDILMEGLKKRLADKTLRLEVTDAAKSLIIERGFDPIYGARPLKRYLQSAAETLIAKEILRGDLAAGSTLVLDAENGELSCRKK